VRIEAVAQRGRHGVAALESARPSGSATPRELMSIHGDG
jgi:hypothetical protein